MNDKGEAKAKEPDPRTDGSTQLDRRAALGLLLEDSGVRNYAIAALGSLAVIFFLLVNRGSDIGGFAIVAVGVGGLAFRKSSAPLWTIPILIYFMWTPLGIPGNGYSNERLIEQRRFDLLDVILILSVLVYTVSHYRLYSMLEQGISFEGALQRKGESATRRPPALMRASEILAMISASTVFVVVGQSVWLVATSVRVVPGASIPFRLSEPRESKMHLQTQEWMAPGNGIEFDPNDALQAESRPLEALAPGASRFFILLGLALAGTLLARVAFGYWQLRTLGIEEAKMIAIDIDWRETNRERVRLEKWRAWGKKRADSRSQAKIRQTGGKS